MKFFNWIYYIIITSFGLILLHFILLIFVYDTFRVNTYSMYPTIKPGDKVIVNKLIFGARLYKNFDFSDSTKLDYFRVKGIRNIEHNDIVVFNQRTDDDWYRTSFKINQVYLKRCIGLPTDTISVVNGKYVNSGTKKEIKVPMIKKSYFIGLDSGLLYTYPYDSKLNWTIENFGPLYIPKKGDVLVLNEKNVLLYKKYIEYETSKKVEYKNKSVILGGEHIEKYKFLSNYYFIAGDNAKNSRDSRYFGLVPEDLIIGVATHFIYSEDPYYKRPRYDRILKRI